MQKYREFPTNLITKLASGYRIYHRVCPKTSELNTYYRKPSNIQLSGPINVGFYRLQYKYIQHYTSHNIEFEWKHPEWFSDDIYGNIWYSNQGRIWRPSKADESATLTQETISWLEYLEPNIMMKKENCLLKPYPTFKLFTSKDQEYRQ